MRHRTLITALLLPGSLSAQDAEDPGEGRADAFVAATPTLAFFSDPRVNLHDFLIWQLSEDEPVEPRSACLDGLTPAEGDGFERALTHYRRGMSGRDPGHDDLMLDLRFHLIGHPDVDIAPDRAVEAALEVLEAALPAYRACWWADHDARNRAWIADVIPLVIAHGDTLGGRLEHVYRERFDAPLPVDVVGYVNWAGANTVVNPGHVLVRSGPGANTGHKALEILFHEASHTLVHPRFGAVAEALDRAAEAAGLERPPRDLWHALLFYTTGVTVRDLLAERGAPGYEPYAYSEGVFARAWPDYVAPLEVHWQRYLDGDLDMDAAARRVVAAVAGRP